MTTLAQKQSTVRDVVAAMTAYTLELRAAVAVKLNQNENPYDLPGELKQEVLPRLAERAWNVYPDFESVALRSALGRAYALTRENLLVGNGSNELLAAAIGTFIGPGTPVVFPRPAFTLYEKLITIAGGIAVPVEFDPDSGVLPLDEMLHAIESVESPIVVLCSPNNPTGGVLPSGGLEALLSTGAVVLFDRAYGEFAGDRLPPLHDRLVTFSTFSKAWGLAALRVGWLAATTETCRQVRKVKLPYSLNVLSEAIAIAALEKSEIRDANVARIVAERGRVALAMSTIARIHVFPSAANFIAFRTERNCKEVFEALASRGILVRDISSYPRMENCLRVSIGAPEQNDRFLAVLEESV